MHQLILNRIGTACSFLAQLALTASVWICYVQCLWGNIKQTAWTINGLNKAFSVDTSPSSLLNWEMIQKFKVGSILGLFAW